MVCAEFSLRFGGTPRRRQPQIDVTRLREPHVLNSYVNSLEEKFQFNPPENIDDHWSHIRSTMHKSGTTACGTTVRTTANHWVSSRSLQLLDARRNIQPGSENNHERSTIRAELKVQLSADREAWWTQRAIEMEKASATGNSRKLSQLIRTRCGRKFGVSGTICEANGQLMTNKQRRLERWAKHLQQ